MNLTEIPLEDTRVRTSDVGMTRHAKVRGQQRAIQPIAIELLVRFGSVENAPGGVAKIFFDKPARRRLAAFAGPLASLLGQHLDLYAVVGDHSRVITVGHRLERIRRH